MKKYYITITIIMLIIYVFPQIFFLFGFLSPFLFIIVVFILNALFNNDKTNNGKEGYYAQYGESFGANAHKHEQYQKKKEQFIEENIANKIMK